MDKNSKTFLWSYSIAVILGFIGSKYFTNTWVGFFFILSLFTILFLYMLFLLSKYKKTIELLHKEKENMEKEIVKMQNNFEEQFLQKTNKILLECEESKSIHLKEMVKNISSQSREPLLAIFSIVTSIQNGSTQKRVQSTKLQKLKQYVKYLTQKLDILESSLDTKNTKSVFRIESFINEFLEILTIQIKISDINIEYMIEEDFSVYSYKKELMQVLFNIVNNSKDIFEQKAVQTKCILIKIFGDDNEFIIDIKDNRDAIDTEVVNKVFDSYFTLQQPSQDTGLGLYSAYLTVTKKLRGSMSVQKSQYINDKNAQRYSGVNFIITVPKS